MRAMRAASLHTGRKHVFHAMMRSVTRLQSTAAADKPKTPHGGVFPHFRVSSGEHPIQPKISTEPPRVESGEWVNPTINHVWSEEEIQKRLSTQPRHQPKLLSDKLAFNFLQIAYWSFNKVTRYHAADPSPEAVAFRLLFLESIAGVPGMVAAQHRHFRSLRTLSRDYGWIHTLLEEAENERMHLLTFLHAFTPGPLARGSIFLSQFGFGSLFILAYVAKPQFAHRLVGYIEEMAVVTYTNIIEMVETPDTQLHKAWANKEAPEIAKTYWRLSGDASFLDVLKQVAVDETNHRDTNHTFASMARDDPNPYIAKHLKDTEDFVSYWRTNTENPPVEGKDLDFDMTPKKSPQAGR